MARSVDFIKRVVYRASNATPGTGIVSKSAATTYSATAGLCTIYNSASRTSGDCHIIVPRRIRITATTANTDATNFRLVGNIDNIDRYSSGGTALTENASYVDTTTNFAYRTPKATVTFGELTLAAESNAKRVFNTYMSEAVLTADESLELVFNNEIASSSITNIKVVSEVAIGPGCSLTIHEVAAAQSADAAFEVEIEWEEYGHPRVDA